MGGKVGVGVSGDFIADKGGRREERLPVTGQIRPAQSFGLALPK